MLYYLSNALLVTTTSPEYRDVIAAVDNLAISAFESKHELFGDFNVMEALSRNTDLGLRSRLVLNRIVQNYASCSIPLEISYYVEVVPNVRNRKRLVGRRVVVQLAACELLDSKSVQESCLIGEFYYDCQFFRQILLRYKRKNGLTTPVCFEDIAGCGDTVIDHVRQYLIRDKRPTLAIVDSDKKYPSQPIMSNSTCGKCKGKYVENVLYKLLHMNVHEAENLIPLEVIDNLHWTGYGVDFKRAYDSLRSNPDTETILAFFDIKNGIKNTDEFRNSQEYQAYARICCLCDSSSQGHSDFDQFISSLADKGVVFPMLSKNLLRDAIDYMKSHSADDFLLMKFQEREWNRISAKMINWGICRNKEALN